MEERKLTITRNTDKTIVSFDSDKYNEVLKSYNEFRLNLEFMLEQYKENKLGQGMLETHLRGMEVYTKNITDKFDFEGVLKRESEQRYGEIRSLNEENRELRKQLGMKVSNEDVRERMKLISKSVSAYFRSLNLFFHKEKFSGHGTLWGKVSCSSLRLHSDGSDVLLERGIEFCGDDEKYVVASDKNKAILKEMFIEQYPSLQIFTISEYHNKERKSDIKDIEIIINNLDDVKIKDEKKEE